MRIDLVVAVTILRNLERIFDSCGYLMGFYGSVLSRGSGRDIDILAVPKREPEPERLLLALQANHWNLIRRDTGPLADGWLFESNEIELDVRVTRWIVVSQ